MRVAICRPLLLILPVLVATCGKTDGMIRYLPDSSSPVLKAAQIVQVRIDGVEAADWGDQATRQARLRLTVTDVWKGRMPAGPVVITVTQYRPADRGPILPPDGCWKTVRYAAGEQWVVFVKDPSAAAADALAESSCFQIVPSDDAAIDVRVADRIESERLSMPAIVKMVIPGANRIHLTLAHYLRARFAELHLEERENFNAALELVATPALNPAMRATLLDSIQSYISTSRANSSWHIHRLAVAMFGLLSVPEASDMYENLIDTDLPNLLGLTGGAEKQSARAVFEQWPQERLAAVQGLNRHRDLPNAKILLDWINQR